MARLRKRSRSESESEQGVQSSEADPKLSDLPMGRLKRGYDPVEDRTDVG